MTQLIENKAPPPCLLDTHTKPRFPAETAATLREMELFWRPVRTLHWAEKARSTLPELVPVTA
jgi:hypothetical protein